MDPLPERSLADHARTGAEAAVAVVPIVGGAAQVLFDSVLPSSFERRRDAWLGQLAGAVNDLAERTEGFDVRALGENEVFISGVVEASRIAMGTHIEAKLEILKRALVTLALEDVRDLVAMRFLRFIDELEPEHFLVLEYADAPARWFERRGLELPAFYTAARRAALDQAQMPVADGSLGMVLRDLHDRALVDAGMISGMVSSGSILDPFVTPLGGELLRFVRVF